MKRGIPDNHYRVDGQLSLHDVKDADGNTSTKAVVVIKCFTIL